MVEMVYYGNLQDLYYQVETTAATDKTPIIKSSAATTIKTVTCPGVSFDIPTQKELEDETAKRKKEEKMRLKVNRKAMFSKKGR